MLLEYAELCKSTSLLVKLIPWIYNNPSAHVVIDGNNSCGLRNFTESGLEANNKDLRQYRLNYARKTSQHDNSDCLNRLWDKSDPIVNELCNRLHCSHCNTDGHTIRSCQELRNVITGCNIDFEQLFSVNILVNIHPLQ